jgi:DNA-binding transcriptional LysR family regulator
VHLTLSELPENQLRAALNDRSVEIGFLRSFHEPEQPDGLVARLLLREGLMVAMRPDHALAAKPAITVADLKGQPMIFYQRGVGGGFSHELMRLMRASNVEPIVAQEVHEVSTLLGLVGAGIGITIVARSLQVLQSGELVYRQLDAPGANSALWLIHPRDGLSEPGRRFAAMLEEIRPANQAAGTGPEEPRTISS